MENVLGLQLFQPDAFAPCVSDISCPSDVSCRSDQSGPAPLTTLS
jgi:hypothetical protein